MSCPAPDVFSLITQVGLWIALAELAYGAVKYLYAPLPQRREAVDEFWGVAVGAAITAAVAFINTGASTILGELSAFFNVPAVCPQDLLQQVGMWIADISFGLAAFFGLLGALAIMSSVSINIGIVQIRFPGAELASILNNYSQAWITAVQWSLFSLATLYAVALLYEFLVNKGLAALGVALLLPRRTRELGSWLVSIWLVLYFFVPLAAGFYKTAILPYVSASCGVSEATADIIKQAQDWLSSSGWGALANLISAALNAAPLLTGLIYTPFCLLVRTLAAPIFAYKAAVGNILLDISFAAAVAVIIYIQDLIEEAPNALIPSKAS